VPPPTVVRRRRAALLSAAGLAFLLGLTLGAGHHDTAKPTKPQARAALPLAAPTASPSPDAAKKLELHQQVGKLVILRFDGTTLPRYVRDILHKGWAAGVILFKDNITSPQQLKQLTADIRKAAGKTTPIICTDQEGGAIRNITWAPPQNSQRAQVPGRDATAAAKALKQAGLNVSLAPVADVPSVDNAAMANRAFSTDATTTAKAIKAAVNGWRAGGVAPTAKHFPGLGGTTINTDHGSTTISAGAPTPNDLAPFKAAIEAQVPLIMSSHAVYPRLDANHIASQSPAILQTLLRQQLGYQGVVMTDSIEAAAARATGQTEQLAVRSVTAGDDIVLTTGRGSWIRVYRALLAKARASRAFLTRVQESAARVLALQRTLS
jgi:beta-N-acetylhexosaminidase